MDEKDHSIEMEKYPQKESVIMKDNKPYNITSTSNEVQNIFNKIRKKQKRNSINKNSNDFINEEFKDILVNNNKDKQSNENNIDIKNIITIVIISISFIAFYFSFSPISNYFLPISYFIFPMDFFSLLLCTFSSIVTAIIICLILIKKLPVFHLLYMILYYIIIFFLKHNKFIGKSHFDQSLSIFFIFISIIIHFFCIFFICYFYFKHNYFEGFVDKDSFFVKSMAPRWQSSYKIRKSENESKLLNDESNNYFSYKKRNKCIFYLASITLFSIELIHIFLLRYKKGIIFNCDNWDIGINGTKINNENSKCQIKKPNGYCYMDYFKGYFNLDYQENNCSLRNPTLERKNFLRNIEDNNKNINIFKTNIFAFPLTNLDEKYSLKNQKNIKNFGFLVNNDIYDFGDASNKNKKPKPEAILDFSDNNTYNGKYAELKINLNYNKTLSEKRKLLENTNSLFNNILMINLESTSRAHFQRSFPKLSNFIKNFMTYDPLSGKKIGAYQFMKYHSFGESSSYNIVPMFYGNSFNNNKGINIIKYFKENGFITGHEIDMCSKELYNIEHENKEFKDEREYEEWDHENIAYLCDGNYFEISDPFPSDRGAFSEKERCLYGHKVSYYMIDYAKQFWEKYSINKKFFRMGFNYGNEKTGTIISNLDEPLYDFIFDFYNKGYFDNTALFIVSSHGNIKTGIYNMISNSEFELEKKMGTFILLLSKSKNNQKYEENLIKNQEILVTPYDIHDTMILMTHGDNNKDLKNKYALNNKGNSVLLPINQSERSCKKYDDWLKDDFCCKP